jgi:hypothetical protein
VSERRPTIDFGAPDRFGAHIFRVEIPASRHEPVVIVEDYGYRGQEGGIPRQEERVILRRSIWSAIADTARREFNDRLKAAKILTGRWHTGVNLVDRLLGKELCVLAWAAETADPEQLPIICSKWAALQARGALVALLHDRGRGRPALRTASGAGGGPCSWRCPTATRLRPGSGDRGRWNRI